MTEAWQAYRADFENQWDVLAWIALEDLESLPSSTLHRKLSPLLRPAYETKQRFVFTNSVPIHTQTLDHVINLIDYLDLSRFFIVVLTNQQETYQYLQDAGLHLVYDQQIESGPRPDHGHRPMFANKIMCAHAWAGFHVDPNGQPRLCCSYSGYITGEDDKPFNVRDHDVETIMSSTYMNRVREQFRQGVTPQGCSACSKAESINSESKRSITPYKLANIYPWINWEEDYSELTPLFLGGHFGNLCNLKCRICSPDFSSVIAAEELQQVPRHQVKQHVAYKRLIDNNWTKNKTPFWSMIKSRVPRACNFELLGGEPFMLADIPEFLQWLVDQGHSKNCMVETVTNGTSFPQVLSQADRFRMFTVTLSIDNTGPRFEFERSGAKWQDLVDNVARYVELQRAFPNIKLSVCITVSLLNVLYLPDLLLWLQDAGIDHYFFNLLRNPKSLSLDNITADAKSLVLDRLVNNDLDIQHKQKLQYIIDEVRQHGTSDGISFCQYVSQKDCVRRENFALTHPEMATAMNYRSYNTHD